MSVEIAWIQIVISGPLLEFVLSESFNVFILTAPLSSLADDGSQLSSAFLSEASRVSPTFYQWQTRCGTVSASCFVDAAAIPPWIAIGLRRRSDCISVLSFPPVVDEPPTIASLLDASFNDYDSSLFTFRTCDKSLPGWQFSSSVASSLVSLPIARYLPHVLLSLSRFSSPSQGPAYPVMPSHLVIYDPVFPVAFPCTLSVGTVFGNNFGMIFSDEFGIQHVREVDNSEISRCFSFPEDTILHMTQKSLLNNAIEVLSSGFPFACASAFARHMFDLGIFP